MKMEFCSQRIEMCLFLATTMAAMTSRANQQYPAGVTQLVSPSCVTSYCETMFNLFTSITVYVTGYCYCSLVTVEVREDKI